VTVPSLEQRVSTLEDDVRGLRAQTRGWAEFAVSADRKAGAAGEMLTLLYRDTTAIRETLARHDERFSALETRLSGVEAELATLRTELGGLKTELGEVKTNLGGLKTELGEVKTNLGGLKTELSEVETDLGGMNSKLDVILERLPAA
jgi:chromosome segregation ATPase